MDAKEKLQQMLAQLWEQHRAEIDARVELISQACDAVDQGSLTEQQREAAHSAAHKLAGVLGTFGRTEGTNLARSLEKYFANPQDKFLSAEDIHSTLNLLRNAIS